MSRSLTQNAPLGSRKLLSRILDQPNLVAAVQALPAQALGKLIEYVGLEDSGEIVTLATTEQIKGLFDDDLWRSERPGKDETFDADRFALWLEVMLEAGEEFAAQRLAELPEDLVTLAMQKHVLVINIDQLAVVMSNRQSGPKADDDALMEKALESCLCEEIGEFRIISLKHDGWDAILSVLLALDRDHHDLLQRVLERCCYAASEYIEDNGGLYEVLTSEKMLEADVAGEREDRRAEEGFVAPSTAASFLSLARTMKLGDIIQATDRDPVTRAYFRTLRSGATATATGTRSRGNDTTPVADSSDAAKLVQVLRDAEVLPSASPLRRLEAKTDAPSDETCDSFSQAVRELHLQAAEIHAQRMAELAYLANVLVAGCSIEGRSFRSVEAARAVVAACSLGLEYLHETKAGSGAPIDIVQSQGADKLFMIGWWFLHQGVVTPAARCLERLLAHEAGRVSDRRLGNELGQATAALRSALAVKKPWTARSKLVVLCDFIEPADWSALLSLIDECPHLSGKLRSIDEAQTVGEIRFVATQAQLAHVKSFLDELEADFSANSGPR